MPRKYLDFWVTRNFNGAYKLHRRWPMYLMGWYGLWIWSSSGGGLKISEPIVIRLIGRKLKRGSKGIARVRA